MWQGTEHLHTDPQPAGMQLIIACLLRRGKIIQSCSAKHTFHNFAFTILHFQRTFLGKIKRKCISQMQVTFMAGVAYQEKLGAGKPSLDTPHLALAHWCLQWLLAFNGRFMAGLVCFLSKDKEEKFEGGADKPIP